MKVVHVVRQFAPSVGGLEEAVLQFCLHLRNQGVEASVLTLNRVRQGSGEILPAAEYISGIPVTRVPFRGSWRYPIAPDVLSSVRQADIVHVHAIDFFFDYLALTKPIHKKPLLASTHGGFFHTQYAHRLKHLYFQTVTRLSAKAYDCVCASSVNDWNLFHTIAPSNLHLVQNGVDTKKWHDRAARTPVRQMIAIGRFAVNKQLVKLMPLLHHLRQLNPEWRLTIAGRDAELTAADLGHAAASAGLGDCVDLLVAPDDAAIGAAIERSSYVVSASSYEGFGLSAVEGMSAGLVPVLNRIAPFQALVAATGCGLLIDIDDPARSAAEIEAQHGRFASRFAQRERCIDEASRYGWAGSIAQLIALYKDVVDDPAAMHPQTGRVPILRGGSR